MKSTAAPTEIQEAVIRLIQRHGSLRAAARAVKMEAAYMSHLHTGRRTNPSEKILRKLGLERETTFRPRAVA